MIVARAPTSVAALSIAAVRVRPRRRVPDTLALGGRLSWRKAATQKAVLVILEVYNRVLWDFGPPLRLD